MDLGLTIQIVIREKLFSGIPYQRKKTQEYFAAIKDNDYFLVQKLIT